LDNPSTREAWFRSARDARGGRRMDAHNFGYMTKTDVRNSLSY
jgi:hypothetical protein